MKQKAAQPLTLHRETLRTLTRRHLGPVAGGGQGVIVGGDTRPVSDTCLCAPTYWETCEGTF